MLKTDHKLTKEYTTKTNFLTSFIYSLSQKGDHTNYFSKEFFNISIKFFPKKKVELWSNNHYGVFENIDTNLTPIGTLQGI